ncbi:substrate-binding domain-containing protein [Bizionia sediminis]|uniref:Substrate-binding domain-containing protein n=1 Tax=Bizionia sediminis TaxID=1737064 RepID=A0ABW5KSU7_9FLAO
MKTINIGGVPEHFNLAWYLTLKEGLYKKDQINLRWHDYPDGTGAMCEALRDGHIDMAVILTEGIIKDVIAGNPTKIIQTFVKTPLIWGIHVAAKSQFQAISDLKGKKAAISRYGSGSHLMTYIHAKNNGWDLKNDLKFTVVDTLEGAVTALNNGTADYFMWEKFMTKPLVDTGVFRRLGKCPTPWPCFVIAARTNFISQNKPELQNIINTINKATKQFKSIPDIDKLIAARYNQQLADVQEWLSLTEWSDKQPSEATIYDIQQQLLALDIIPKTVPYNALVHLF